MMWYVLLAANLAISLETVHTNKEETELWACRRGQAVPFILEAVAQASAIANNEVTNPVFVNTILSATSDSRIYCIGIVNHSVNCILLDTSATGSVLNEGT